MEVHIGCVKTAAMMLYDASVPKQGSASWQILFVLLLVLLLPPVTRRMATFTVQKVGGRKHGCLQREEYRSKNKIEKLSFENGTLDETEARKIRIFCEG